jgi:predicted nucleic acid-binding protein
MLHIHANSCPRGGTTDPLRVIDASVFTDALLNVGPDGHPARAVVADEDVLRVPEVFPTEVLSAARSLLLAGHVSEPRARRARTALTTVRLERFRIEPFIDRIWDLRENLTVYGAAYVALAERLEAAFVTADRRIATAAGPRCPVVLVSDLHP